MRTRYTVSVAQLTKLVSTAFCSLTLPSLLELLAVNSLNWVSSEIVNISQLSNKDSGFYKTNKNRSNKRPVCALFNEAGVITTFRLCLGVSCDCVDCANSNWLGEH